MLTQRVLETNPRKWSCCWCCCCCIVNAVDFISCSVWLWHRTETKECACVAWNWEVAFEFSWFSFQRQQMERWTTTTTAIRHFPPFAFLFPSPESDVHPHRINDFDLFYFTILPVLVGTSIACSSIVWSNWIRWIQVSPIQFFFMNMTHFGMQRKYVRSNATSVYENYSIFQTETFVHGERNVSNSIRRLVHIRIVYT